MRFFIRPIVFLATASAAYLTVSTNGTSALQILSFLNQLEVSILDKLAIQTNSTSFHQASEQEQVGITAIDYVFKAAGADRVPRCNYRLPNSTSSLISLKRTTDIIRTATVLGMLEYLQDSHPSLLLPVMVAIAVTRSLQETFDGPQTSQVSERTSILTPITPEWAFSLITHFMASDSCAVQPTLRRNPALEISSRNGTSVSFTWEPLSAASNNRTLYIGWASQLRKPIYSPVKLTSPNSGTVSLPDGLWGFVVAVLTGDTPNNVYDLSAIAMSGPAIAEIVF
ncbi:hypothetical protein QBC46DRAFT_400858 [Diplogelasinospora grovesii]|uniref:Fibronectin type-III domain-containing protein n=1 Tax=Diplogelasinospora grovesii TaxID=303347 RepID=A0AAN6RZA8_9PEZI|nr:hypothetical protein QBC46DRAFT_400858 [Diplogelasinospora grovesii]